MSYIVVCLHRVDRVRRYVGCFENEEAAQRWAARMSDENSSWEYWAEALQEPPR